MIDTIFQHIKCDNGEYFNIELQGDSTIIELSLDKDELIEVQKALECLLRQIKNVTNV